MKNWAPDLTASNAPRYHAIADAIEADLKSGRLSPGDRLPAQRQLANQLGLDFTTVARGYSEARKRGLLASRVGSGTFVTRPEDTGSRQPEGQDRRRQLPADFSMNLAPEPDRSDLTVRMEAGYRRLDADLVPLLRYQTFAASEADRHMAARWLEGLGLSPQVDLIQLAPGAQAALSAILSVLTAGGDRIACEAVTYPGIRSLCAQLRLPLVGLATDDDGPLPDAFEAGCRDGGLKALYLNPTLHNPTTRTIPVKRRHELVAIARQYGVPILEDDAYGQLSRSAPPTFAAIAPEQTWYIGSLSKSLGAGLRLAHVVPPNQAAAWQLARALRTASIMVSPLSAALATSWIEDGTAAELLAFVRKESSARQALAAAHLSPFRTRTDPDAFHLWLELDNGWTAPAMISQMRSHPIGLVEGEAFAVSRQPPNAVRVCLGGPHSRAQIDSALGALAATLAATQHAVSTYF